MVILAIYTMRKRGLSFSELLSSGKISAARRAPPPPPKRAFSSWDQKSGFSSDYGSMKNDNDMPPQPAAAISRSGSLNSQRPLALERSDSFTRTVTVERSASPETGRSFLLESPPIRNNSQRTQRSQRTHRRDDSATPSSPILPLQDSRRSASTRNTRSMTEGSELQFQDPPREEQRTPLPPPPTFKQFLFNRPSVSGRPGFAGGMASRFSWTNSNAPQTPHDTQRDTNTHNIGRDSYMTSRSSVPRFRTIDSWVNQQTNRLEEQQLREQFRWTQTTTSSGPDEDRYYETIPEVPDLPSNVDALREEGNTSRNDSAHDSQIRPASKLPRSPPPPPIPSGLPGKNIKHERHDTRATIETAPIFRAHPGTEVRFSTRSTVPSEILDMGRKNTVLS
ncbi:hypothetical protein BS50DRAFT_635490 [Corynespora cassiicola Philippines]|uniref:Uncharacterized protein n=1 Tax=Corynespora cassiicola Philippines TaxID=1448308 RepID=A0A2T2NMS8_CORCC|nr:hypothetical protein BS50DRAFT_635490 [Corynespora cassiicola Philippines]